MGIRTDIEWCDSTVNCTSGCDGCELWAVGKGGTCYAGAIHEHRLAKSFPDRYAPTFTEVRLIPGRMAGAAAWSDLLGKPRPDKPWLDGLPRHIFVGDMADVFSQAVPFEYLESEIIDTARSPKGSRHVWMLLTKQVKRLCEFADWLNRRGTPWPLNVWPGTSVTSHRTLGRARKLDQEFGCHHFLSVEPLLGPFDLTGSAGLLRPRLVIVGGESGPRARPYPVEWAAEVVNIFRGDDTPTFVKQLGSRPLVGYYSEDEELREWGRQYGRRILVPTSGVFVEHDRRDGQPPPNALFEVALVDRKGGDPSEWPGRLRVRRFPAHDARATAPEPAWKRPAPIREDA